MSCYLINRNFIIDHLNISRPTLVATTMHKTINIENKLARERPSKKLTIYFSSLSFQFSRLFTIYFGVSQFFFFFFWLLTGGFLSFGQKYQIIRIIRIMKSENNIFSFARVHFCFR